MRQKLDTSERRTCRTVGMARSTQQYKARKADDDEALRLALIQLAKQYGRYGYRKIAKLLRLEGWVVNHKKVERLDRQKSIINRFSGQRREEGLQLPK
ncbi:MAG: IS3 family transposase, partial [Pseudomonadota bacterium]